MSASLGKHSTTSQALSPHPVASVWKCAVPLWLSPIFWSVSPPGKAPEIPTPVPKAELCQERPGAGS